MPAHAVTDRFALTAASLAMLAGTANAGVVDWLNALDGNWIDGINWNGGTAPGEGDTARLGLTGAYTVSVTGPLSADGLNIPNPDAVLTIDNARSLSINSATASTVSIVNDGTIVVNTQPAVSFTVLNVGGGTATGQLLAGPNTSGSVVLNLADANNEYSDARLNMVAGGLHGSGHTVRGKGEITGDFTNAGLILADRADQELRVGAIIAQDPTGVLRATGDAILGLANGAAVSGGTVTTDSGGAVRVTRQTATLRGGAVLEGDLGVNNLTTLNIDAGGVTNNGVISVNAQAGINFTQAVIVADTTIDGTGSIDLNLGNANNDLSDATLATATGVIGTIGVDQSVTGKGRVSGSWINNGTFRADRDGQELRLATIMTQDPAGVLAATNNAILGIADNGVFNGGLIVTDTGGRVSVTNIAATIGGGLINTGELTIDNGRTLAVGAGGIVNNGTVITNTQSGINTTTLRFDADTAITGTGTIDLNISDSNGDFGDALFITTSGIVGTIGDGQSVTGKGQMSGDFVLNGTVNADRPGQDLRIVGTADASGGGIIKGTNGGSAVLDNCALTGGTLRAETGGTVDFRRNDTTLDGVTNEGDAAIRNSAAVSILSDFINSGTLTINKEQGINTTVCFVENDAVLRGPGEFRLNMSDANGDFNDAQVIAVTDTTATNAAAHTIAGKGRVSGAWINNGTIAGDRPGQSIELQGSFDQTGGGVIRADDAGNALLRNAQITGGTLTTSNAGLVDFLGNSGAIDAVTNLGDAGLRNSAIVDLRAGGLTNNGTLTINTTAGINTTILSTSADATIGGTGTIALGMTETNGDFNDASIDAAPGTLLTIGAGQTVTGKGRLRGEILFHGTYAPGNNPGGDAIQTNRVRGLDDNSSITLSASSEFAAEASAEEVNDAMDSNIPVTLQGGTLRFTPIDGFEPPRPTRYTIIDAPEITGTFDTLIYEGTLPEGGVFRVVYEDTEVIAAVTCKADIAAPIGVLDLADITVFTSLFLAQSPLVDLAPPEGVLDLADISAFVTEFLAGCGG